MSAFDPNQTTEAWRWGERKLPQRDHQPIEVGGDDQSHLAAMSAFGGKADMTRT
jgi:hypothetical protein